ncbi:unnamed protein product [Angiostrongylus costaricensis]|uniref:Uncharacterized protein n=1 Tax=Angiostrongylus costaricensis TaxID=334426 RepID=A0A0R3PVV6_ANGCS|nr:unnamed protein product [Angiostrongylus costaricensis]
MTAELLWDNHVDEDIGDLLDLVTRISLSTRDIVNNELDAQPKNVPETDSSPLSDESLSTAELERIPKYPSFSLLRRIQAHIDLRPGFVCAKITPDDVPLSENIHRQLIMDEIRSRLDTTTMRVYARRHDKGAALRRAAVPSFFVPRRRGINIPPSYLALIEKMNPMLFSQIHNDEVNRLPRAPMDIQ